MIPGTIATIASVKVITLSDSCRLTIDSTTLFIDRYVYNIYQTKNIRISSRREQEVGLCFYSA